MVDRTSAFATIWGKATGGRTVAVDPHSSDKADFTVSPAPGVAEACDWVRAAAESSSSPRMVFLVGGPGGGKSHALNQMTIGLTEVDVLNTGLAQRKYHYQAGASRLTVLNDASIRSSSDRHPLADDIDEAAQSGSFLVGCVNRGILVEEAYALENNTVGASVVKWLAGAPNDDAGECVVETLDADGAILARGRLQVGATTFELVSVNVDYCSLLEPRPHVGSDLTQSRYKIKRLKDRAAIDLSSMPAGALLGKVSEFVAATPAHDDNGFDPVWANVHSLSKPAVRSGLLTVLRSAEAVAGARLTFREVWGAILRALVGDLTHESEAEILEVRFPPISWSSNALSDFEELQARARFRYSEAIFGVGTDTDDFLNDPVLRFTAPVDPVLDAVPGRLDSANAPGWASPVLEAFSGLTTSASPLETLIESLTDSDPFEESVTEFDQNVDKAFVAVTQPGGISEPRRREVVGWYGDYLSRLYAISHGVSAFRQEVATWLDTRNALPSALDQSLKTLLRPPSDPGNPQSDYLLPLFASRTIPLSGTIADPELALKGESVVELKARTRGDAVTVEMHEGGKVVGEIELDFALVRSAMACSEQRLGMTEQAVRVGPRVERFRAKRLASTADSTSLRLISAHGITDVYLEA